MSGRGFGEDLKSGRKNWSTADPYGSKVQWSKICQKDIFKMSFDGVGYVLKGGRPPPPENIRKTINRHLKDIFLTYFGPLWSHVGQRVTTFRLLSEYSPKPLPDNFSTTLINPKFIGQLLVDLLVGLLLYWLIDWFAVQY